LSSDFRVARCNGGELLRYGFKFDVRSSSVNIELTPGSALHAGPTCSRGRDIVVVLADKVLYPAMAEKQTRGVRLILLEREASRPNILF
jgi:hypothetical protein